MIDGPAQPRITPVADDRDPPILNIFRTMSRNHDLSKSFLTLGGHLLFGAVLPPREREIVILRAGWQSASEYEFGQHTIIGLDAGLTTDEVARLADADTGDWSADDAALVAMVDELCTENAVSDATWAALAGRWTEPQLIELLVLAGFYRLVSGFLNSVGVALESQTPGWPAGAEIRRRAPRDETA